MDTLSLAPVTSVIFVIATALYVTESWVATMSPVETPTISNRFDPAATVWLQVSGVADPPRLLAASKMGRASTVNNGLVLAGLGPSGTSVARTALGPGRRRKRPRLKSRHRPQPDAGLSLERN